MASKQTRRSISVRGTTYSLLRDFCAEHDRSMSDVVEELLGRILESDGEAKPRAKTVAPLVARSAAPASRKDVIEDRAAVRVVPLPKPEAHVAAPAPARAAIPPRPAPVTTGPARPTQVANAGRPAPTPAPKAKSDGKGDYRAIRF